MLISGRSPLVVPLSALVISFAVVLGAGLALARPPNTVPPTIAVTVDGAPGLAGLPLEIRDQGRVVARGGLDDHGRYAAPAGQQVCLRPPIGYAVGNPDTVIVGGDRPENCLPLSALSGPPVFRLTPGITVHVAAPAFAGAVVEIHDGTGGVAGTGVLGSGGSVVLPDPAGRPLCVRPPFGWTVVAPAAAHNGIACAVFAGPYATFTAGEGSSQ